MKDIKLYRAWDIVYPVGLYYVLSNVAAFLVTLAVPYTKESYGFIKVLTTLITFPFIYKVYRMDLIRRGEGQDGWKEILRDMKSEALVLIGIVLMAFCAAIVLNNLIAWTPLMDYSANYQQVSEAFFGGSILFEILGPCIFVPILEEYVFRGLVYGRLREWLSVPAAVLISAVIFGMMHMNIVQFLYAGLLGIFMALCAERTKRLYGAILAHMVANTISVIRTETDWLRWMEHSVNTEVCVTVALSFVFLGLLILFFGKMIHSGKNEGHNSDTI